MNRKFRPSWLQICGVLAFGLVIFASLMLPAQVERMRTGHWFTEHFVGYFVAGIIICLGMATAVRRGRNSHHHRNRARGIASFISEPLRQSSVGVGWRERSLGGSSCRRSH